ncbi:MFS transporter [Paracoccaceae bacterium GXU_MW_L88]
MKSVLLNTWTLLLGVLLLMIGNGLQGTLLGVRGAIEGLSAGTMSFVMTAYFAGFLAGSRLAPVMISRVGHVRVFAALGSVASAAFILYGAFPDAWAWIPLRFVVGLCFSGVYVVAESWLNDTATNETRGITLSTYMFMQMGGIIIAQVVMGFGDPTGYQLFVLISVLVSLSFAPILLTVAPTPVFGSTRRMTLKELYKISPLGIVGLFILGAGIGGFFGMAPVYGTSIGLSAAEVSTLVGAAYLGGLLLQFPIGYLSDRMDRRQLIIYVALIGVVATILCAAILDNYWVVLGLSMLFGGLLNPLYSLLISYTNDLLDPGDMAAGSGGALFVNGLGAVFGPLMVGWLMGRFGPNVYFPFTAVLLLLIASYAVYRSTKRAAIPVDEQGAYVAVTPTYTPVLTTVAGEYSAEQGDEDAADTPDETPPETPQADAT